MSSIEERNMERVKHWEWTWNNDVMRMVDECYAEDCEVTDMRRGRTFHGREELRLIEKQMKAADPSRRLTVVNMVAAGNTVGIELETFYEGDKQTDKSCVFLTFNEDGFIITDHSYGSDPTGIAENDPRSE
ncbi:MAG: nuclear transport factor 2 family protein [Gammaproteobacteria bacterium]|nr:nuclear transport factor 2 family protein [Gammaproteobacteria bacterium]